MASLFPRGLHRRLGIFIAASSALRLESSSTRAESQGSGSSSKDKLRNSTEQSGSLKMVLFSGGTAMNSIAEKLSQVTALITLCSSHDRTIT